VPLCDRERPRPSIPRSIRSNAQRDKIAPCAIDALCRRSIAVAGSHRERRGESGNDSACGIGWHAAPGVRPLVRINGPSPAERRRDRQPAAATLRLQGAVENGRGMFARERRRALRSRSTRRPANDRRFAGLAGVLLHEAIPTVRRRFNRRAPRHCGHARRGDGTLADAAVAVIDDEGTPTNCTVLVENGA
jgi:hypothetical protein